MSVLVAEGVSKRYGGRPVLSRVDLRLEPGRLALVSGRSGSGKSTLFSILAGFERPSEGRVRFGDRDLAAMTERERDDFRLRHIGVVFQDFRLLPDLNVVENVRLPLELARRRRTGGARPLRRRALRRRALALVEQFGLAPVQDRFPETLSGGEQQRVAVARALANDPPILLADEPTANLDEENAHVVMRLFKQAAQAGRIVLVAAHDPLVLPYADRVWRLTGMDAAPWAPAAPPSAAPVPARGSSSAAPAPGPREAPGA